MAIKLHGVSFSTCTTRVLATLHEKGVSHELVSVDMAAGAHKQQPFLSMNPFGQIPVLQDEDLTLFESRACSKYVALKYKDQGADLLRHNNLEEAAMVSVWLEVEAQQFNPAAMPLVGELVIKPKLLKLATDHAAAEAHAAKLEKVLDVYEERLSKAKYLAGDFFSLADLYHYPCMCCLMTTPKASLITSRPHVLAWWKCISSRPAWAKVAQPMKFWE